MAGQEAAAKRANLMAQRQEAQEDLDSTVKDHIYNMQVEGLDDMMTGLKDDLQEWKDNLHSDIETQNQVINDAIGRISDKNMDGSIASLLSGISQTQITSSDVSSILNTFSDTLASKINVDTRGGQTGATSGGSSGGSSGSTSGGSSSGSTSTPKTTTPTASKTASTPKTTASTASKTATTATTKQTVTAANAQKALNTLMSHLKYSSSEGSSWGVFNKELWHKTNFQRKVYVPHEYLLKAYNQMGFNVKDKNFKSADLLNALQKTGAWAYLAQVRTKDKGKVITLPTIPSGAIHGYAKGGIVHKSGQYLTDEKGEEIIITKQGILRPLSAGTSVIPADITERLYAIASNYNMGNRMRNIDISKFSRMGNETISPIINCPITIEGNADEQDVINAINKSLPKISKHVQNDIRKDLRKSGR